MSEIPLCKCFSIVFRWSISSLCCMQVSVIFFPQIEFFYVFVIVPLFLAYDFDLPSVNLLSDMYVAKAVPVLEYNSWS